MQEAVRNRRAAARNIVDEDTGPLPGPISDEQAAGREEPDGEDRPARAVISDEQAKTIASMWTTENPLMAVFVRSGAIESELIDTLTTDARLLEAAVASEDAPPVVARAQLRALVRYVQTYGPRGPIGYWPNVGQADPVRGIIEPIVTENFHRAHARFDVAKQRQGKAGGSSSQFSLDSGLAPTRSIYLQLGAPAIADVVTTFYKMMMSDPELAPYFEPYDVEEIMAHQHAFLCAATGGPLDYLGRSIRAAHGHLNISNEHFDRTAEHLTAALAGAGVSPNLIAAIIAKVGAFRSHVVAC